MLFLPSVLARNIRTVQLQHLREIRLTSLVGKLELSRGVVLDKGT